MLVRRKLIKQGPSTITVSLPATWVKDNKLTPGQEVLMTVEQNTILITADAKEEEGTSVSADVRQFSPSFLGLFLSALHKKGFDEVRLQINKDQLQYIEERISKNLLGYEIIQHTNNTVVIRFVTKIDAEELPVLIRRVFLVTLSLAEEICSNPHPKELLVLEETNNRLTNYCERILVKNLHRQRDGMFLYIIIWVLEKIADEYRDIIKNNEMNSEDSALCHKLLKQFYELFYKYTTEKHDALNHELDKANRQLAEKKSAYLSIVMTIQQTGGSLIGLNVQ